MKREHYHTMCHARCKEGLTGVFLEAGLHHLKLRHAVCDKFGSVMAMQANGLTTLHSLTGASLILFAFQETFVCVQKNGAAWALLHAVDAWALRHERIKNIRCSSGRT